MEPLEKLKEDFFNLYFYETSKDKLWNWIEAQIKASQLEPLVMPKITDDADKIFNRKDMWQSFVEGHTIDGIEPRLSTLFDNWIYDYIRAKNESNFTG